MRTAKTANGAATLAPKIKNSKPETQKSFRASKQPAKKPKPVPPPPIPAGLKKPAPTASEPPDLERVIPIALSFLGGISASARQLHGLYEDRVSFPDLLAALQRLEASGTIVRVADSVDVGEATWRAADQKPPAAPKPHLGDSIENAVTFIHLTVQYLAREIEENWPVKGGTYASGLISMSHDVEDQLLAAYDAHR